MCAPNMNKRQVLLRMLTQDLLALVVVWLLLVPVLLIFSLLWPLVFMIRCLVYLSQDKSR